MNNKTKKNLYIIVIVVISIIAVYFIADFLQKQKNKYTQLAYDSYINGQANESQKYYKKASWMWFFTANENYYYALQIYINKDQKNYLDNAIKRYKKSSKDDNFKAQAFNNIGNCYRDKYDFDKAKEYYEKSIQADSTYTQAYVSMINLLVKNSQDYSQYLDKAMKNLSEVEDKIKIYYVLLDLNSFISVEDNNENIIKNANEILKLDPDDQTAKQYIEYYKGE